MKVSELRKNETPIKKSAGRFALEDARKTKPSKISIEIEREMRHQEMHTLSARQIH